MLNPDRIVKDWIETCFRMDNIQSYEIVTRIDTVRPLGSLFMDLEDRIDGSSHVKLYSSNVVLMNKP